ncbi:MAG: MG2 domain-containing protein [Bacteroidota bacterium]
MSKRVLMLSTAVAVLCLLFATLFRFESRSAKEENINPAFSGYVSAFTSGTISSHSTIRILLATDMEGELEYGKALTEPYFEFSPAIKGTTTWLDSRTLCFEPAEPMPSGQEYKATFHLGKLIQVPSDLEEFGFGFSIIKQNLEVNIDGITTIDKQKLIWQKVEGSLLTADIANDEDVQKILTAKQDGKKLRIDWQHQGENRHSFTVDSVRRGEKPSEVVLEWNGKAIGAANSDNRRFQIPALGDFKVMDVKVIQSPDQYVSIRFSDPLLEKQELAGMITVKSTGKSTNENVSFTYVIEDNEIRAYPVTRQSGAKIVTVQNGIKNILNYPFKEKSDWEVEFEELNPQIELIGRGVILPNSDEGLIFPFKAVSLRAVDVKIIKIFESNIAQFLQVNSLDGNREMKRVGRMVLKKTVKLNAQSELEYQRWNTYSLDLSELIETEPGAIYKVVLSFKKQYAAYHCDGEIASEKELEEVSDNENEDPSDDYPSGYYYDDYYYNDYYDYDYNERDNPCDNSYYYNKSYSRNILASDLGIIAKSGTDGSMNFVVADLKTAKPMGGVTLELLNYQQQTIEKITTDGNGMAKVELKKKPFLLIARNGKQRGYLKLDDGSSLSLSAFDVSGEVVQKGVKGYIYGERGVWRPGDSLFLTFMLEDKLGTLPLSHPVAFELLNPQGQVVKKMTRNTGLNGFYNFSTSTDAGDPTGNWTARIKVGGAWFTKLLKIETIMPNRLKLKLDFGKEKIFAGDDIKGTLMVKWLHGAIAKNLDAKVEVSLNEMETSFPKFPGFVFTDPAVNYTTETQTIFDGKLNQDGEAEIKPNISASNAPGMLRASFVARVFEQGGAFSIDRFSLPFSPYDSYVGLKMPKGHGWGNMLFTDTNNIVQIATVDEKGNPVSRKVKVQLYKVNWRWWWDEYDGDLANYVGSDYHLPLEEKEIKTVNGKGQYILRIDRPEWGRYFVRITDQESGHSCGQDVYIDWPWWAGKSDKGENDKGAVMLSFNADKEKYAVGEQIKLTIPSGSEGRALVSIETGSKVLQASWVDTKKGQTEFSFEARPEMAPNIYVHVTLVQPHAQTENDLPIRMYGVIPVLIDDPNTHLRPVIQTANVWKPESKETVTVSEENGKSMTYTLAVVDEGLLDLTRFQTPDPWAAFYAREALGVKTWDMYDMVMGAYGGKLQSILAIGGDGEVEEKEGKKANRFKPMVRFIGPFFINKGEKKTHTIDIPQYIGSVRVMVVAGQDFAYGSSDKTVPVRKPLMVLATLPRVVGPNEDVELPVNVFAMEKFVKNVSITVSTNEYLSIDDASKKSLTFKDIGDEVVNFKLKVKPKLGVGKVKVVAVSGNEKATYEIEIDVRNPNPPVVDVIETVLQPGQKWNVPYTPVGMTGTNKGLIELSNLPPIDLGRRLRYLIQYPHGCIEQTTSSAFPQLFVGDVMDLPQKMKSEVEQNVKSAISRIKKFQTTSGGFGYWPGSNDPSDWGTNYAGHFLLEAMAKGYSVPDNLLNSWKKYQKQTANDWEPRETKSYYYYYNDDLEQAYRLYTLALAKAPELGAMNRLREYKDLSVPARWRLAAAYQIAGYPSEAKKLVTNASTTVKDYSELSYSFGSDERDEAMILEALSLMGETAKAFSIVKLLSAELSNEKSWMSTQTTAYCLIAISKFAKAGSASGSYSYTYSINGSAPKSMNGKLAVSQVEMDIKNSTSPGNVMVQNNGTGILYARIILEGIPEAGDQSAAENDLKMSITYKTMDGKTIDPEKLEQGTDFYAEVSLTNPGQRGYYKEMALTQIFPSGWEIHNTRMDEGENAIKSSAPTYQDIRDDRVYTYFDLAQNETKTFRIILNSAYMGKFYLPTIYCEAMYDNTINSRKPGKWVQVVSSGESI